MGFWAGQANDEKATAISTRRIEKDMKRREEGKVHTKTKTKMN